MQDTAMSIAAESATKYDSEGIHSLPLSNTSRSFLLPFDAVTYCKVVSANLNCLFRGAGISLSNMKLFTLAELWQ